MCNILFKKWMGGLYLLFFSFHLNAQDTWTLEQCIQYANEHNLTIQQIASNNNVNEIRHNQAKAMRLPSLSANIKAGRSWGRSFNQFNVELVDAANDVVNVGANLALPLFNGMTTHNTIKQNQLNVEVGKLDLMEAKNSFDVLIVQNYLQLLQLQEQNARMFSQIASTKELLEAMKIRYEKGLVAEHDVLQLKAQLLREESDLKQSNGQVKIAKINLMQLMNLQVTEDFNIQTIPNKDAIQAIKPLTESVASIYQKSLDIRPEIASAELQKESTELGVKIAKGKLMPSLSFNASLGSNYSSQSNIVEQSISSQDLPLGYLESNPSETVIVQRTISTPMVLDYGFWEQLNDNFSPFIGVNLSIPIFSNKSKSSQVEISKVSLHQANLQAQQLKNDLRKNIEIAYADLENAMAQYEANIQQWELSKRLFENAQYSYEAGLISTTDLTIEKNNLNNTTNTMVAAKYQYIFSQNDFRFI